MRRIADTQKTGPGPLREPVDSNGKKTDVFPIGQLSHSIAQEWRQLGDVFAKSRQPALLNAISLAFGNDESALPIVGTIDGHHHLVGFEVPQHLVRIPGLFR